MIPSPKATPKSAANPTTTTTVNQPPTQKPPITNQQNKKPPQMANGPQSVGIGKNPVVTTTAQQQPNNLQKQMQGPPVSKGVHPPTTTQQQQIKVTEAMNLNGGQGQPGQAPHTTPKQPPTTVNSAAPQPPKGVQHPNSTQDSGAVAAKVRSYEAGMDPKNIGREKDVDIFHMLLLSRLQLPETLWFLYCNFFFNS